ncbi:MAG: STAS domain-containing protein [Planctomycetota bacterium]|jgi:anti-anti-sigma factor
MKIESLRIGEVVVLTPVGDVDLTKLPAFDAQLDALLEEGVRALLWDLERVTLWPSTAIGFLLSAGHRIQAAGGRMGIANAGRLVRSTLNSLGIGNVYPIYEDRKTAIRALASEGWATRRDPEDD